MARRNYTDKQKAAYLAALDGYLADYDSPSAAIRKAADDFEIPESTLRAWSNGRGSNPDVAELCAEKKVELADECEKLALKMCGVLLNKTEQAEFKDNAVAFGIVVDKMQVLRNQPSSITKDVSDRTNEARADKILGLLNSVATGGVGRSSVRGRRQPPHPRPNQIPA